MDSYKFITSFTLGVIIGSIIVYLIGAWSTSSLAWLVTWLSIFVVSTIIKFIIKLIKNVKKSTQDRRDWFNVK